MPDIIEKIDSINSCISEIEEIKEVGKQIDEKLKDIYQDSSIALFQNILLGRYEKQEANLYTYFLKICINQANTAVNQLPPTMPLVSTDYPYSTSTARRRST